MQRYLELRKKAAGRRTASYVWCLCSDDWKDREKIFFRRGKTYGAECTFRSWKRIHRPAWEGFMSRWIGYLWKWGKAFRSLFLGSLWNASVCPSELSGKFKPCIYAGPWNGARSAFLVFRSCQNYLNAGYRIFVAEVASTCNEALLIHDLMEKTEDKKEKAYLINYFLEQFRTTLYRQTMFAHFEQEMHQKVEQGETLTADVLCDATMH